MTVYVHHNMASGTNSYLLGPLRGAAAIMIDPGSFDGTLLRRIEDNGMYISHILVSKPSAFHIAGIKTIKRIYDARIVAPCRSLLSFECQDISDETTVDLDGFQIEAIAMPEHAHDSVIYLINGMLFSGEVMSAGLVDVSASPYGRVVLIQTIRNSVFTLPPDTIVFSSFGPPTTVGVEIASSPDCLLNPAAER